MNMVNMSIEMKKPYTPMLRSVNQRKYSFFIGSICQDSTKPNTNTGVEGVAAVAGVALLATGAVVVAKKRK